MINIDKLKEVLNSASPSPDVFVSRVDLDALIARVERAEAENKRLREALGDVVNPLGHLHRKAESEGKTLGWLACQVANDLGFVQQIARAALEPPQRSNR